MFLIDGHNLIGSGALADINLAQPDDEARLVAYLRSRQPALGKPMTVVFDGGIPGGASIELSGGGVHVVFSPQGRGDADSVILSRVRQNKRPQTITVVSNDGGLLHEVEGAGARGLRVAGFLPLLDKPQRHPYRRSAPVPTDADKPLPTTRDNEDLLRQFEEAAKRHPPRSRR